MKMAASLIPRFDGRDANWWLIQAKQYFGSRKMNEGMKFCWVITYKQNNLNTCWLDFAKAAFKKLQPEIWDCLMDLENEEQNNHGVYQIRNQMQEPLAS